MGPALFFLVIKILIFGVAIWIVYAVGSWIVRQIRRGQITTDANQMRNRLEDNKYRAKQMIMLFE